jgi:hypothetical protein
MLIAENFMEPGNTIHAENNITISTEMNPEKYFFRYGIQYFLASEARAVSTTILQRVGRLGSCAETRTKDKKKEE